MRVGTFCLALVAATGAQAQETPRYAETASDVANAIRSGNTSSVMPLLPKLSAEEVAVLQELSKCDASIGPQGNKNFVQFAYACPTRVGGHFDKLWIGLRFTDAGDVFAVELNPIFGTAVASDPNVGTPLEEPPAITREFARAVKEGEDPTLGGLIPIAAFQLSQLDAIEATKFSYREIPGEKQHPILFHGRGLDRGAMRQVSLHFDDAGRPLGISIMMADVRRTTRFVR